MASGIIQVTRQIGIAVGIAALGALFHAYVQHALAGGIEAIALVGAAICALGALAALALAHSGRRRVPEPEPATA